MSCSGSVTVTERYDTRDRCERASAAGCEGCETGDRWVLGAARAAALSQAIGPVSGQDDRPGRLAAATDAVLDGLR
jgi:hypothetical protein